MADVEFAPVRVIEDLRMDPAAVAELGFRVLTHWSGAPAVSEKDAYALVKRREMLTDQYDQQHRERAAAQQSWWSDRELAFRAAYAEKLGGRMGGEAHAEAREAGLRARLAFERKNAPEPLGIPAAARTDPEMVEHVTADRSRSVAELVS